MDVAPCQSLIIHASESKYIYPISKFFGLEISLITKSQKNGFSRTSLHTLLLFLLVWLRALDATAGSPLIPQVSNSESVPSKRFTNILGSWIWVSTVSDLQTVRMWKSFEIPGSTQVKGAQLYITADDEFD